MDIAIIGTGRVGASLAGAWAAAGHTVRLGARDPEGADARELAGRIGARLATPAEPAAEAEVVVLAVHYDALAALVPTLAEIVDIGGLEAAPLVEAIAATWITLAYRQGRGPDFAFALTTPRSD